MNVNLEKLLFYSGAPAFKQVEDDITGTFAITGTTGGGVNAREFGVDLDFTPQYLDLSFGGRSLRGFGVYDDPDIEPRPSDAWFKEGFVYAAGNAVGYSNYPLAFRPNARVEGNRLIIRLEYEQQFNDVLTITSENLYYKIVPYANT